MQTLQKNQIWTINNFLSDEECEKFKKQIENKNNDDIIEFTNSGLFKNDKFVDLKLAEYFFSKLKKWINIDIIRPNNLIMTGKYIAGNVFDIHTDTGIYYNIFDKEKSNYTLLIYLNDDFDGGKTIFYDNYFNETVYVKPEKGKALLFDISLWHKGEEVISGEKYWIGCEIISKM